MLDVSYALQPRVEESNEDEYRFERSRHQVSNHSFPFNFPLLSGRQILRVKWAAMNLDFFILDWKQILIFRFIRIKGKSFRDEIK